MREFTLIHRSSRMIHDGSSTDEQFQSIIKCHETIEIHLNSITQQRDGERREWILLSKWKQASGLEVNPMEERWLQLLSAPIRKKPLRVVCLNDKPFTFVAKHYETKDAERPCEQGLACKIAKVFTSKL